MQLNLNRHIHGKIREKGVKTEKKIRCDDKEGIEDSLRQHDWQRVK